MPPRIRTARQLLLWAGVLIVVGALMVSLRDRLDNAPIALGFLLVVLGASSAGGQLVGITIAAAAFVAFNFFFLPPRNTLIVANPGDWLVLIAFLITGLVAARLLELRRRETELARSRAEEIDRIASLGAETLNAPRAEDALDAIATVISAAMPSDVCEIYLADDDRTLRLSGRSSEGAEVSETGLLAFALAAQQPAAELADGNFRPVGALFENVGAEVHGDQPLTGVRVLGIPLSVRGRIAGALRLSSATPFSLTRDQRRVLGALSYYAALGAERVRLTESEEEAEALRRADRVKDALLASVSHDLRTPLTAIKGIANEVWRGGDPLRAQIIEEEADRLNHLVGDLLQLSQLNAGSLRVNTALNTADDVVGAALERVEAVQSGREFDVHIANDGGILVGQFDFAHTMRALTNLLENAANYSPAGTPISVRARRIADRVRFVVEDRGPGVAPDDEATLFEPFQRGSRVPDGVRGTGLGLSIARQLAEAQGGTLTYTPRDGGGSTFTLELPAGELPRL